MKYVTDQAIRRHRDGSIDTAYYLNRACFARSRAAHNSISYLLRAATKLTTQLLARVSMHLVAHRTSVS